MDAAGGVPNNAGGRNTTHLRRGAGYHLFLRRGAVYHPVNAVGGDPNNAVGRDTTYFFAGGRYHPVNAVGGDPNNAGGRYTTHSMIYERRGAVYHPTKPGKWYALTDGMVNFLIKWYDQISGRWYGSIFQ